MFSQWIFILALLLVSASAFDVRAESPQLCANPRPGSLPLGFSIPNFSRGEFDLVCADRVSRAIARGFTVVTITPKISFNRLQNQSMVTMSLDFGELTRCLNTAWNAGLDIIYSPHVESETPGEKPQWRAFLDLKPDRNYELAGFEEFLQWTNAHAGQIGRGPQKVRVSLETELETSTTRYPFLWNQFTRQIRQRLVDMGLGGKIPLGIQPNWYPIQDPSIMICAEFENWIASLDFVSPSMYGDWLRSNLGATQVSSRVSVVTSALQRKGHFWCQIPQYLVKPFGFGEFCIGSDLAHTERTEPVAPQNLANFMKSRREIYGNLLAWMKTQSNFSSAYPIINIWSYGIYDPTGLDQAPDVISDPQIVLEIQNYKAWRCQSR